jgi:uncharacterized Fe-S cluster protein YjdI
MGNLNWVYVILSVEIYHKYTDILLVDVKCCLHGNSNLLTGRNPEVIPDEFNVAEICADGNHIQKLVS